MKEAENPSGVEPFLETKDRPARITGSNKLDGQLYCIFLSLVNPYIPCISFQTYIRNFLATLGSLKRTAEILADLANEVTGNGFKIDQIYDDIIPDERRSRRRTETTKFERILVMRKK